MLRWHPHGTVLTVVLHWAPHGRDEGHSQTEAVVSLGFVQLNLYLLFWRAVVLLSLPFLLSSRPLIRRERDIPPGGWSVRGFI